MNFPEKHDLYRFTRTPFLDARPCVCGMPRDVLERDLLHCCVVNREALRLVVMALGFNAQFLMRRSSRALWAWLSRPRALRNDSDLWGSCGKPTQALWELIKAENDHKWEASELHGCFEKQCSDEHCAICLNLSQRQVMTTLAIAGYLMRLLDKMSPVGGSIL